MDIAITNVYLDLELDYEEQIWVLCDTRCRTDKNSSDKDIALQRFKALEEGTSRSFREDNTNVRFSKIYSMFVPN